MIDPTSWTCPVPLRDYPTIVMGHGGGGQLSQELITNLFLPAFAHLPLGTTLQQLGDAAVLDRPDSRLAFTTDCYVVSPRFFPGGNLGDLAINGTCNDLAVSGATPVALSLGAILEEGLSITELGRIVATMSVAAQAAGVSVVTGDTKVVERGHGDGVFLITAGIGVIPDNVDLGPHRIHPGDAVVVSGPIGAHGVAVLSVRDGLEFGVDLVSDTACVTPVTTAALAAGEVKVMRDPTRGGVAATLNEFARAANVGIELVDQQIPVQEEVSAACAFLGLDPLHSANEGRVIVICAPDSVEQILAAMQATSVGAGSCRIGTVVEEHPTLVLSKTQLGSTRVIDLPFVEQLPRIC